MARASDAASVAQHVYDAIQASGVPADFVAEAADLTPEDLKARLAGDVDFDLPELVKVGGFLHIRPSAFLNGAAA